MPSTNSPFASIRKHKVILFDFDRTIISLDIDWAGARAECRKHLESLFPEIVISPGTRMDEMEAAALEQFPHDGSRIFGFRRELEGKLHGLHTPQDQVVKLIEELSDSIENYRLFIVSNNLRATVIAGLKSLDLLSCFEGILGVDDVMMPKPSIRAVQILHTTYGADISDAILIGDSPTTDGEFCKRASIPFFDITQFTTHR